MTNLPILDSDETHFTTIKNRHLAKGPYTNKALEEHLNRHASETKPKKRWCSIDCMASVFGLRRTEENRREMRRRISRAAPVFLARNGYLLKKFGMHGDIIEVKFYTGSLEDREFAITQYEHSRERGEESVKTLEKIAGILGIDAPDPSNEPPFELMISPPSAC